MKLSDLHGYEKIVIQCHDNPDADGIGAGYALYHYFKSLGKEVRLIYSGKMKITKPNFVILINELHIPIEHVKYVERVEGLLITVDCQYGAGNVTKILADDIAIIDHHQQEVFNIEKCEIRSYLSSASTLVWHMLLEEDYNINEHMDVATALYYGLYCDSSNFAEISHPLDRDMRDSLKVDHSLIRKLKKSNMTLSELKIAGIALIRLAYDQPNKFAIVKAKPCDPNILGLISDLALQVDSIYVCVVYNEINEGIKFSVRTCTPQVMANELAAYISEGMGSGGGHLDKAGGFISKKEFNKRYPDMEPGEYFYNIVNQYYNSFDVIDILVDKIDVSDMELYKRKPIDFGCIRQTDVLPEGTSALVRTLEGDINIVIQEGMYIVVGIKGEVYFLTEEEFNKQYKMVEEKYNLNIEYFPSIKNKMDGRIIKLDQYARKCVTRQDQYIYVSELKKPVKIFTATERERYLYGREKDYLAVSEKDLTNVFIIDKQEIDRIYVKI